MSMEQETLIYVEENDKKEARVLTQSFANKEVKSRAYINALGAELGLKYLALENINNSKTYNLHNVHKIIEELDISDIMLSNIHIDVRVVFDENLIFIPKSHFEYDILPDIYLVLNLSEDHAHAKFLGFFEPKLINKNNQNDDYYFIEKEKLSSPLNLKEFIENFKGNTTNSLSEQENGNAEMLMVSLIDQNVSKNEMKELLKYLAKSSDLRDKFIEFENFEVLSYKAEHSPDVTFPKDIEAEETIDATIDDIGDIGDAEAFSESEFNEEDSSLEDNTDFFNNEPDADISDANLQSENEETIVESLENSNDIEGFGEIDNLDELSGFDNDEEISGITDIDTSNENSSEEIDFENNTNVLDELSDTAEETADLGADIAELSAGAASGIAAAAEVSLAGAADLGLETTEIAAETLGELSEEFMSDTVEDISQTDDTAEENLNEDLPSLDDMMSNDNQNLPLTEEETDIEIQDLDTIETVDISQNLPETTESEMEVLDISGVDAVPNNLDANISETIEFNNIEPPEEEPCLNAVNMETTSPTMSIDNIDNFAGLEPINSDDMEFSDNSVDIEKLSAEPMENIGIMPMDEMDPFAPVDLDNINLMDNIPQNNGANIQQQNEEIENSFDEEEIGSSLDEIPDFGADLGGELGGLDEISDISNDIPETSDSEQTPDDNSVSSETSDIVELNELENLTVDDIVETPIEENDIIEQDEAHITSESVSNTEISEISDFSDLSEIPDENPEFSEIAGLDDLAVDAPASVETPNADENSGFDEFSGLSETNGITEESATTDDIENITPEIETDDNELTMLFNENPESLNSAEQIQNLESPFLNRQPKQNSKMKVILIAVVAALILGASGLGLMLKNKHTTADIDPLAQEEPETEMPSEEPAAADNSDILANTPAVETIPAAQTEPANIKEVKPAAAAKTAKPINPQGTYVTVKKLSWEVPDYLSYSNNITKYLQTAGKSIKLSLSSDLLLTSEYAYSNQVKVAMTLSNDGNLKDINIVKSSGSDQINKIVLQTVKDTLNVIKPATGEVPTPEFKLGLTINF